MGTVTQYNLANVQAALGGANPISMSEYYRGGAYVPTTRTVTVREPTSGEYYNPGVYSWSDSFNYKSGLSTYTIYWAGNVVGNFASAQGMNSYTSGSTTYYRGTFQGSLYGIYRTYPSTTSINTGVPASGAISLSQLFGAANP